MRCAWVLCVICPGFRSDCIYGRTCEDEAIRLYIFIPWFDVQCI
jgi:hypothetical protein